MLWNTYTPDWIVNLERVFQKSDRTKIWNNTSNLKSDSESMITSTIYLKSLNYILVVYMVETAYSTVVRVKTFVIS